jgi:hypothetical protein
MLDPQKLKSIIECSGLGYKQNSRSWIFACPRCGKKDKLYIRKTDGRFCCFVCKELDPPFRGRVEYALSELLGLPVGEARRQLYGDEFAQKSFEELLEVPLLDYFGDDDEVTEDVVSSMPAVQWPYDYYPLDHKNSIRGVKYLEGRGIPAGIAEEYGLRYCPHVRRVAIPVVVDGKMLGWQGRSVIPTEFWNEEEGVMYRGLKVTSTKGLRRDLVLLFGDRLKGSEHAVVTEGPFDAIKAHLCGGNVATMGKAISDSQLAAIKRSGVKRVYLALDPDAAAEMDRVCRVLSDLELYNLQPAPGYKDLGEMSFGAVLERFHTAPQIHGGRVFVFLSYR